MTRLSRRWAVVLALLLSCGLYAILLENPFEYWMDWELVEGAEDERTIVIASIWVILAFQALAPAFLYGCPKAAPAPGLRTNR